MNNDQLENELSAWVRTYTKELYAWAYQKTSDRQLAEDLVQETFLAAAESIASFKRESGPKTWLFAILRHKIAEYYSRILRRQFTRPLAAEDVSAYFDHHGHWDRRVQPHSWPAEPEQLTDIPAFNRVLDACLAHLPELMQACIRLKFLDEKKGEQICQDLGISATNYWQVIRRAKLQLRACLEKNWFLHS